MFTWYGILYAFLKTSTRCTLNGGSALVDTSLLAGVSMCFPVWFADGCVKTNSEQDLHQAKLVDCVFNKSVRYFLGRIVKFSAFSFPCVLLCEISEYARIDRIPNMHECSILGQQRLQHRCGTWIDWKILGEWIWTRFKVVVRGPRRNIHQVRNKAFFSIFPRDFRGHSPHFEHPISLMIIMLGAAN